MDLKLDRSRSARVIARIIMPELDAKLLPPHLTSPPSSDRWILLVDVFVLHTTGSSCSPRLQNTTGRVLTLYGMHESRDPVMSLLSLRREYLYGCFQGSVLFDGELRFPFVKSGKYDLLVKDDR